MNRLEDNFYDTQGYDYVDSIPYYIDVLISHGANVNERDNFDRTPLIEVLTKIIDSLVFAGADVNAKDFYGKTALDYARENNNIAVINILEELTT